MHCMPQAIGLASLFLVSSVILLPLALEVVIFVGSAFASVGISVALRFPSRGKRGGDEQVA